MTTQQEVIELCKVVEAMEMELRLIQQVAGTRCICEHDGGRVERGNGPQWNLLESREAVCMAGGGPTLGRCSEMRISKGRWQALG